MNITLDVKGYTSSESDVKGNKKVKNNGKEVFDNRFEWKGGNNTDADLNNMYMYYPPEIYEIPNSPHKLRLAFANLVKQRKTDYYRVRLSK